MQRRSLFHRPRHALFVMLGASVVAACGDSTGPEVPAYTEEELDYFSEIAFGPELGGADALLRKWRGVVRIRTHGTPTAEDEATLAEVIEELNALIDPVQLERTATAADVEVYFAPEAEFSDILPPYTATNYGFFWLWWNGANEIIRGVVLISTEKVTQRERSHLIREELTQSMGLMRDSPRYPGSIFQQAWTSTTEYARIDRVLIEMLYREELVPGMTREVAIATLRGLTRTGRSASIRAATRAHLSWTQGKVRIAGSAGGS